MNIFGIMSIVAFTVYCMGALALLIIRRRRLVRGSEPAKFPRVTILKPLKGLDDGLQGNLESFFTLDYPDYEIIFGASEEDDPAVSIARALMIKHPLRRAMISIGSSATGANPKVRNLIQMIRHSRGELIVISDSNTRVDTNYLRSTIHYFNDPDVALVSHFLAGAGERTAGAIFEHLHICGYIAAAQAFATIYARITPIIGKSMIIRKSHLDEVGGVSGLADYLAEDYLLGRKLVAAGRKVMISPWTVTNYNSTTPVRVFFFRHYRWLSMRWRIYPMSCLLELIAIPLLGNLLWFLTGASSPFYPIGLYIAYLLVQQYVVAFVRGGRPLPLRSIALSPVKDALHLAILFASLIGNKVEWRDNYYKIGWKTKLTPIEPPPGRVLRPCIFSARLGDPWPLREKPYIGLRPVSML